MIYYKTRDDIEHIRQSCLLVSETLAHIAGLLKPGVTGSTIDKVAEEFIRDHDAIPGFKGYGGFPATLCISKNECVVHGIPDDEPFTETDIVSIDCGSFLNAYYGDAAFTFAFNGVDEKVMSLLVTTEQSLYKGIEQALIGNRIGDIGHAVQKYCESHGYSVVRELVGHGIGKNLHEAPEVPNYGRKGRGPLIKEGLVIAIEPMINLGKKGIKQLEDGWSIVTKDQKPSAHYEHTIAVTTEGPQTLSDHETIKTAIKNNPEIRNISLKK